MDNKLAPGWLSEIYEDPMAVVQHLEDAEVEFTSGLLEYLVDPTSTKPVSDTFHQQLESLEVKLGYGVYVLVLQKDDVEATQFEHLLYCGSGTNIPTGVATRLGHYDSKTALPKGVRKALEDGWAIQRKILVAFCRMPNESAYCDRMLFLIIGKYITHFARSPVLQAMSAK
ncbi:Protein kinase C-like 1 [Neodidymelliopsis sp. IMI 364377]|nr:Protein kinase C-like 1 [Neodidymelliopsis sp. IMI 364377]